MAHYGFYLNGHATSLQTLSTLAGGGNPIGCDIIRPLHLLRGLPFIHQYWNQYWNRRVVSDTPAHRTDYL
jgi:hypothetical protein